MAKNSASSTSDKIDPKRPLLTIKRTHQSNEYAAKMLREYLQEKTVDSNFDTFSAQQLDEISTYIYLHARTLSGNLHKAKSLESVRHRHARPLPVLQAKHTSTEP